MRIAILGTGHMGRAIGARLLEKGHSVVAWNRTPGRTAELERLGASSAKSAAEAAQDADGVLTLLTADEAVRSVAFEGRVLSSLRPGAVLVDMSTVSPETSRGLGRSTPGGRFVDAPILGGPEATRAGRAKLLLGGDRDVVDGLDSLWQDIAADYYYCGSNGSATTLKLLSNLMLVGGTALLAEAIVAAQRNGIDDETLKRVFKQSPAIAPGVQVRFDDILAGDHDGWWTIHLAQKDMSLALHLGRSTNLQLPVAEATVGALDATDGLSLGEKDLGAVVELIRSRVRSDREV
jgi:3-hydroxyisobutyrate dehydrogenase-like beta-hydroxyacid dehydrogenase